MTQRGSSILPRTLPTELFGLETFIAGVAITFPLHGLPSVANLTAPLDEVPPARRVKSKALRGVGPTRACEFPFATPVVTEAAKHRILYGLKALSMSRLLNAPYVDRYNSISEHSGSAI